MRQEIKYEDWNGIKIPYYPTIEYSVVGTDLTGSRALLHREQVPPYINHIQANRVPHALHSMRLEGIRALVDAKVGSYDIVGMSGHVGGSASIPRGAYLWTMHGPMFNEEQIHERAVDQDGDVAALVFGDESDNIAVMVKSPITKVPLTLYAIPKKDDERFYDLTLADLVSFPLPKLDLNNQLYKAHHRQKTGLLTAAYFNDDLIRGKGKSLDHKLDLLSLNPHKYRDIEDDMKGGSKDGKVAPQTFKILDNKTGLKPWSKVFVTGSSRVVKMREDQVAWFDNMDPTRVLERALKLDVDLTTQRPQPTETTYPESYEFTMVNRLIKMGVLKYQEIPHFDPKLPPCIQIWLEREGEVVGLEDNRRSGILTFCALLPPVLDMMHPVLDEHGDVTKWEPKICHPLEHLNKFLAQFDSRILWNGGDYGNWPRPNRGCKEFEDFPVKTSMLCRKISDYIGKFGRVITIGPGHDMATYMIRRSISVDYNRITESEFDMCPLWKLADQFLRKHTDYGLAIAGGGKDEASRIYPLADPHTRLPVYAKPTTHPRRTGKIFSQLVNGIRIPKMTVAVLSGNDLHGDGKPGSQSQCWITPSGVEKQLVPDIFLDQISHVPDEEYTVEREYTTLAGEHRVCYSRDPKESCTIGKLIDVLANKFIPKPIEQARTLTDIPIDIIVPLQELVDKGNHVAFLKDAREETIIVEGTPHRALVIERILFRTGVASENMPPRNQRISFRGLDMEVVWNQVRKIRNSPRVIPDLTFVKELQEAIRAIRAKVAGAQEYNA